MSLDSEILTQSWVLITEIQWNSDPNHVFHISLNHSSVVKDTTIPHTECHTESLRFSALYSDTALLETQLHQYRDGASLPPCRYGSQGKVINDGCK